jgi:hypothetical protein
MTQIRRSFPCELLLAGVVAFFVGTGCGDEAGPKAPAFTGTLGTPSPAMLQGDTFVVNATLQNFGEALLFVDSGSPITLIESTYFPEFPIGQGVLDTKVFGLQFGTLPVVFSDFADISSGNTVPVVGLFGGDTMKFFAVTFDYATPSVTMADEGPSNDEVAASAEAGKAVEFDLLGGGQFQLSDGKTAAVGATRIVVGINIEGRQVVAVLDTGASFVVLDPAFFHGLPSDGRPMLSGINLGTVMGMDDALISRVKSMKIGDAEVQSVEVAVVPNLTFVSGLAQETGRAIQLLLGGTFLREFLVTIDYPRRKLILRRYHDRSHIRDNRFIRVGFFVTLVDKVVNGQSVKLLGIQAVVPGSDAARQGISTDDIIVSVNGAPVAGQDPAGVDAQLGGTEGATVSLQLSKNGTDPPRSVEVLMENLLPDFR